MSATSPGVDVVIPVLNRAGTVGRAVSSVLSQSYENVHVIVVDDGSTDGTRGVLATFHDPRLTVVDGPSRGAGAARNVGAETAAGDLLVFVDSDDEADHIWLERLVPLVADADIACCGGRVRRPGSPDWVRSPGQAVESGQWGPLFLPGLFLVRRQVFESAGGYDSALRFGENTELGWRLMDVACGPSGRGVAGTTEALFTIHQPPDGVSRSHDPVHLWESAERILSVHEERLRAEPAHLGVYHAIAGVNALELGERAAARGHLRAAVRLRPRELRYWVRLAQSFLPAKMHQ